MESENDEHCDDNKPKTNPFKIQRSKEEKERRQKKRARLIVRNISYKSTEDALRKHFAQWGEIEELNLLKRADGKLVGCAFVQYATITQATKAILKANNQPFLERTVYVDWALGKNEYTTINKIPPKKEPEIKTEKDEEIKQEDEEIKEEPIDDDDEDGNIKEEENDEENENDDDEDDDDKNELKSKLNITKVKKEKNVSNDVQEGCTVFIKNIPFDATDEDLSKVCCKYGPLYYAIINRQAVSGHSRGTGFVKFRRKESADMCLGAGPEFMLMDEILEVHPALSREEINKQEQDKTNRKEGKDSRNLYLAREGLIMAGSKAALDVSAADMTRRHKLEQIKTQVLKDLNRFVSRNRLSIHNLPQNYDNDKLKDMIVKFTGFRPHECRVMKENKISAEFPQGKSKGFGFMSFNTHQEALTALRKLNNNPNVFNAQKRPIVAFSIEDRSVHKLKEARMQKSKSNNPTYKLKQEKQQEFKKKLHEEKQKKGFLAKDDKLKVKREIKKLEKSRAAKSKAGGKAQNKEMPHDEYVGMAAKPGTAIKMRSSKKIGEQSQVHMARVKADKRHQKQTNIRKEHAKERRETDRPKQGRKREVDDISHLVSKYRQMIGGAAAAADGAPKAKKPKRTKWYKE